MSKQVVINGERDLTYYKCTTNGTLIRTKSQFGLKHTDISTGTEPAVRQPTT